MVEWLSMIPRSAFVVLIESFPLQIDSVKYVLSLISGKYIQMNVMIRLVDVTMVQQLKPELSNRLPMTSFWNNLHVKLLESQIFMKAK